MKCYQWFTLVNETICVLSHLGGIQLFATLWSAACQAPLSAGLSRQEYWSGLPFPPPGDLPDPGIKPGSPALQADSLPLSHWGILPKGPAQFQYRILALPSPALSWGWSSWWVYLLSCHTVYLQVEYTLIFHFVMAKMFIRLILSNQWIREGIPKGLMHF